MRGPGLMRIEVDKFCFVCGPENPEGLRAEFQCAEGKATARYFARDEHQGYTGISHGGILAALLDEAMVYAAATLGRWVATAEMTVRYMKPAPTGQWLQVRAEVVQHRRKLIEATAEIATEDGTVLASASGKLIQGRELTDEEQRR